MAIVAVKKVSVFFRIEREMLDGTIVNEEVELQDLSVSISGEVTEHPDFDSFSVSQKVIVQGTIVDKK
jgi:hypothetical protein